MSRHFLIKSAPSFNVEIHMAGSIEAAALFLQRFAITRGLCVSLTPQSFIYTGGREEGFRVGLINYPRFPKEAQEIIDLAEAIAGGLIEELGQHSYSLVTPSQTFWFSRRPADLKPNLEAEYIPPYSQEGLE